MNALDVFTCGLDGVNLIEASAGTGKTWNICGLYLRLLLEKDVPVDRILVVTFTKAATAELRERVRSRLQSVHRAVRQPAGADIDPFARDLLAALADAGRKDREAIRRRLEEALLGFDQAAISTIHGFCQRALADVPFSAGRPFDLELLPDDSPLLSEAAADFWRLHVAPALDSPGLIDHLIARKFTPAFLAGQIGRRAAKPLAVYRWPQFEAAGEAVDESALAGTFERARQAWESRGEEAVRHLLDNYKGRAHGGSYKPETIAQGTADWDAYFARGVFAAPPTDKQRLLTRSKLVERKTGKGEALAHEVFDRLDDHVVLRDGLEKSWERRRLELLRLALDAGVRLFETKKAQRRVASYDDLLGNLHRALTADDLPELAGKLRERFPCALIDEFQDTDPLQLGIFGAIYGDEGPLFLVGDPKQAIYGFRNADIFTYLDARDRAGQCHTLGDNQRSTRALIDGINGLFRANPGAFMLDGFPPWSDVRFGARPRGTLVERSGGAADFTLWHLPVDAAGEVVLKDDAKGLAIRATSAEIARLLQAGEDGGLRLQAAEKEGGARPLAACDIAVLVRSHAQGSAVKAALRELDIGSIELAQASVFATLQAEEMQCILLAVAEPSRAKVVLAALATEILGKSASEIEAIAASDSALASHMARFADYRELGRTQGFGVLWRALLGDFEVAQRFLSFADGERRLTNLRHLDELLQQAAATVHGIDELNLWLAGQRALGARSNEAAQLRLESDANLVQIVTVHKAKGLEYPVVFCPFLWDGWQGHPGGSLEGREYHDARRDLVVDFDADAGKDEARLEAAAEQARLIYVALTRAVHRCYLVVGSYAQDTGFGRTSTAYSSRSVLNWLAGGKAATPADWLENKKAPAEILEHWRSLVASLPAGTASLSEIPDEPGRALVLRDAGAREFVTPPLPTLALPVWRTGSFTSLNQAQSRESEARPDHDGVAPANLEAEAGESSPEAVPATDILHFPRGALAGEAIHAVFERVDFADPSGWGAAIDGVLQDYPAIARPADRKPARMLAAMLADVLDTPLPGGFALSSVSADRRFVEMEFSMPAARVDAGALNALLREHGVDQAPLAFRDLAGYLKGFIDLVFAHDGRFFIVDWKSNHLGWSPAAYESAALARAMREHGYHLQYLLYAVALHRYLRLRLPSYSYAAHFGGVRYLFVRGVRPGWRMAGEPTGVFACRPPETLIAALDRLLAEPGRIAA